MPCRLVVMRHGERIDDLFPDWIRKSTSSGSYQAFDLNMRFFEPLVLPKLKRPFKYYEGDTIISEMGFVLAEMVGRGLLVNKSIPDIIYTSPALRCVQTAHSALKAMSKENEIKIRIEPALFEFTDLHPGQPKFATPEEFFEANFNIDIDYVPITTMDDIWKRNETVEMYSKRVQNLLQKLAKTHEWSKRSDGALILVVGHASTVDLAIGAFREPPRTLLARELINQGAKFPYCCTAIIDRTDDGRWLYNENALPPITYMNFSSKINRDFAMRERLT
ncbi:phosphoglycerate mutase family protein [Onchocerca flexuosa]|uniref:Phosphoglycerate mutase family protein n=1 Tax=Onchocerca flexuosa TaxID=387005 RepID=A0A238BP98_9BILA|nr:phosphoglycerate mutase family protein [Onchocerca flexuosa]